MKSIIEDKYPEYIWHEFEEGTYYFGLIAHKGHIDLLAIDCALVTHCKGYIKWDGCCNLMEEPGHYCGIEAFELSYRLFQAIYSRAIELMPSIGEF